MWRFFASGKFELNLKCLLSDSPFAQPRAAALWQCLFPQKSNFYMGTQHTMTRECRGPTEGLQWPKRKWCASGQRYSPAQRSVSCHQLQTYGGFAAIQDHSALLYLSQGGKKKKKGQHWNLWRAGMLQAGFLSCLICCHISQHGRHLLKEEQELLLHSPVGVRISLYFSTWRLGLPNLIMKNWKSNNPY